MTKFRHYPFQYVGKYKPNIADAMLGGPQRFDEHLNRK